MKLLDARLPKSSRKLETPVVFDTRVVTGSGGGPDKTILNSPRFLNPLGYRMICGYLYPPGDPGYTQIVQKAERYQAPLFSIPDRGPWDWRVITQLLDVCKREQVAIWHGHDYKTNALGLLLKRFWPMRLVTTVHGWVHHTTRTPLYYRVDRFCLPKYERVLCVSDDLYHECLRQGVSESRCTLIENAIDCEDYRRQISVSEAKNRLGFPESSLLIGAVGRLEHEKAFDVLIRALKRLIEKGFDARVVIVGEGSDRARLEALTSELGLSSRVSLVGWQADVRQYYEAMDIFALSSLREGLPNVVLEAMALEVPCVATNVNGVPRLILNGRTGRLVEPNDVEGLANALEGLALHADIRANFRQAARHAVEGKYSFASRMDKIARIYDELLDR